MNSAVTSRDCNDHTEGAQRHSQISTAGELQRSDSVYNRFMSTEGISGSIYENINRSGKDIIANLKSLIREEEYMLRNGNLDQMKRIHKELERKLSVAEADATISDEIFSDLLSRFKTLSYVVDLGAQ